MAQIRKRKLSTLVLCIVFLLTLCGCQETEQFETEDLDRLLLDDGTLAYMESLYGLTREAAIEKLGLSDENATITEYRPGLVDTSWTGLMRINKPTAVQEKEFTKTMGLDHKTALFRAITYTCDCDNAEEMADIAEALYRAAEERYSMGPKHGHFTSLDYLCGEGVCEEIRASGDDKIRKNADRGWSEAWVVGDCSYLTLTVWVAGEDGESSVELMYTILPEEWSRFDPEYKIPFYLRPLLKYGTYVDDWPEEDREKQEALMREKFPGSNPEEE